ncbi:MAG: sulfatase-like hydrolase/transferase, partial [Betaproteobacteria bacterium]|nr:sulfatase-like hydrolase/transferase [Betaproteobacteria bacterium]
PDGSINRGREATAPSIDGIDQFGSANYPVLYNAGWAWAMNTPFQYYKHIASHLGGVRNGLIVKWPGHVARPGSFRTQYGFVTDIAPTVYEATGSNLPEVVDGIQQMSLDGISLMYSFNDAAAPSRRHEQYIENNGNRSFYRNGWMAGTIPPKQLWDKGTFPPVATWSWQLYDLDHDFSQARNVASKYPKKLEELRAAYSAAEQANGFTTRQTPEGRPGE